MADKKVKDLYTELCKIKIGDYDYLSWMESIINQIKGIHIETESYSSFTDESKNSRIANVSKYDDTKEKFEKHLVKGLEHYANFVDKLATELECKGFNQKRNVIGRGLTRLYWYNVYKRCKEVKEAQTWYQKWLAIGVVTVHLAFLSNNKPDLFVTSMVKKGARTKYTAISSVFRLLSHTTREYLKNKDKKLKDKKLTENSSDPATEENVNFYQTSQKWVEDLDKGLENLYENLRLWVSYTVHDKSKQTKEWNKLLEMPPVIWTKSKAYKG